MANITKYKQYKRNQRRAVLESDFSKGMMSTNGLVTEGYLKTLVNFTFEKERSTLIPRPSLRPYHLIVPNIADYVSYDIPAEATFFYDNVMVKYCKECVENGKTYYQTLIGSTLEPDSSEGLLAIITSEKPDNTYVVDTEDDYSYDVRFSTGALNLPDQGVAYSVLDLPEIHHVRLTEDPFNRVTFPVGAFASNNSFYAFSPTLLLNAPHDLYRTVFDDTLDPPRYVQEAVVPKTPSVSEAVSYGYNMLLSEPYKFNDLHTTTSIMFDGILPYDPSSGDLLMTPKKNQLVKFRAYYNVNVGRKFDIVWEWRETTSAEWTPITTETVTIAQDTALEVQFQPPAADMMVRVAAYPYVDANGDVDDANGTVSDTIEKAIVVGFDFTIENYGTASAVEQETYNIGTATGMEYWKGRLVCWGLPKDPTILFLSDYNDPSYFPYPNNIVVFDEPIIYAVEFMDNLAVFTTNKIYQVSLSDDGNSWQTTVLQSHLSINPWDKHLIQTVRNMLYFKSGNYYYMMVPKAQSTTGELTLAPITTPITSFFDNFSVNVQKIFEETYDYTGSCDLISYYNFLDYEDIHNIYLYKFDDTSALVHFDVIYNTVDRTWKVWVYESASPLYPYKPSATEPGLLATTSVINAVDVNDSSSVIPARIIQLFCWDKMSVRGSYLPNWLELTYDANEASITTTDETIYFPSGSASTEGLSLTLTFEDEYADASNDDELVYFLGANSFYSGFNTEDIIDALVDVYNNAENYYTFRNYQFIDTGYRDDELQSKKRYREIQLQINNLDQKNLNFGMEYILDGAPRRIFYKYDTSQTIDEFDPDYGIVYVDSTPFLETDLSDIDITNQWTIDQSLTPEISLWKVRIAVSGKGSAPRLKLLSRNDKRFELISINWISKLMNMR